MLEARLSNIHLAPLNQVVDTRGSICYSFGMSCQLRWHRLRKEWYGRTLSVLSSQERSSIGDVWLVQCWSMLDYHDFPEQILSSYCFLWVYYCNVCKCFHNDRGVQIRNRNLLPQLSRCPTFHIERNTCKLIGWNHRGCHQKRQYFERFWTQFEFLE